MAVELQTWGRFLADAYQATKPASLAPIWAISDGEIKQLCERIAACSSSIPSELLERFEKYSAPGALLASVLAIVVPRVMLESQYVAIAKQQAAGFNGFAGPSAGSPSASHGGVAPAGEGAGASRPADSPANSDSSSYVANGGAFSPPGFFR